MNRIVLRMLLASGVDCLTASQAGNRGFSDDQQLEYAATTGRAIVTHNRRDFQRLMASGRRPAASTEGSSS